MGYASESKNKGWGLPIGLLALILMIALMGTAGAPTPAFAANIDCGQCHGTYDNGTNAGTNNPTDRRGITIPGYENSTMPQTDNGKTGRGLHGLHMNYSSATYGNRGTQTVNGATYPRRGNCSYCHNGHPRHESGFVNFTASAAIVPVATQPLLGSKHLMLYTSAGRGVSYKNNISSLDDNAYGNCTVACHKGTSATNTAPWGNYTSASIKLNCVSCHDDSSNVATTTLSGNHKNHLLSNCTTPAGILMSGSSNAGCQVCHPDNRSDLWSQGKSDDGSKKAYPHASDGTNVASDKVVLAGQITSSTKAGLGTTCANNCHPRSSTITWNGTSDCNMCHYYGSPTLDTDNTGMGSLSTGHNPHFKSGNQFTCTECHPNHADASHASKLPIAGYNVTVLRTGMTYDNVAKTCNNTGATCHGTGTTPSFTGPFNNGCGACHYYPGAPSRDWSAGNGHMVRYNAPVVNTHMQSTGFNYQSDKFEIVTAGNGKCGQCHKGVTHRNGTGFAHLSSVGNAECGTGSFTVNITKPGLNTTCSNVKCHSGKTTPNWW